MPRTKNLHSNIAAFLDMLSYSEGTYRFGNDDGYNVVVGGSLFNSYEDHPRKLVKLSRLGISSTAAGRYQILARYWDAYKNMLKLKDFSPESQDAYALQILKERLAIKPLEEGDVVKAIDRCSNIWASLPGAGYGQHEHNLNMLVKKYVEFGGKCKS